MPPKRKKGNQQRRVTASAQDLYSDDDSIGDEQTQH